MTAHTTANMTLTRSPAASAKPRRAISVGAAGVLCSALIAWGYASRDSSDLAAYEGLGYALGVIGLAAMLLLLLYSLRKRARATRDLGPLRVWFEVHMVLGLVGPTAILFHSNFRFGSTNSTVALIAMLLVAGSGIAGRFIYTRIHVGLLGQRATASSMREGIGERRRLLGNILAESPEVADELSTYEQASLQPTRSFLGAASSFVLLGHRERRTRRRVKRAVRRTFSASLARNVRPDLDAYLKAVRRAAELRTYELLFSTWHALHLPLCVLLFGCAAAHVLAVHFY